ncbi:DUF7151 family protein [Arenibacter echinorum]|uniref:DUF7151 domain-containing protein n=1 Tax=Arenibacter echinorum TaxID=440515 RepID=A0A327RGK8_9FLAO|nr:hypothetical protein [Arenibacter echinorum]RAJ16039.1 hypothetical protein LV92_00743 [Arenibacter echinorum]
MLNTQLFKITILLVFLAGFVGCSPEDGTDGLNGSNGIDGSNGFNGLIKTLVEQPGENCSNGGFSVQSGLDVNANGALDTNEVTSTEYLCNGDNSNITYQSYVSLLSQSGTENPSSNILENTLDLNISWVRESQGKYVGTLDKTITIGKTVIFYTTPTTHTGVRGELIGNNQVRIELQNGINAFMDNFSNLSFELRQYE